MGAAAEHDPRHEEAERGGVATAEQTGREAAPAAPLAEGPVVERWDFHGAEGSLIRTTNYVVHTTAVDLPRFVDRLPLFLERALEHYTTALGDLPLPEQPMEVYLFRSRGQWQIKTRQMLPNQADIFNSLGRGGFTTRGIAVLYYIDYRRSRRSRDTFAITAHEGWHQYTQQTFRHQLPIWLEEGIATYMESFALGHDGQPQFRPWTNTERRSALARAVRGDGLIPLNELLHRSPQSFLETGKGNLLVYYGQVWALARFLAEGEGGMYRADLTELLQDAAAGRMVGRLLDSQHLTTQRARRAASRSRTGPWIIKEYFNADLEEFERQYMHYIGQLVHRGNR